MSYLTDLFFISGSLAETTPTNAPTFASSWTSMIVPSGGLKVGGSSTSETLTRTMVWSRNEPKSTKRGSTCLFTASTTTLCVRLVSKSSGWKIKHNNDCVWLKNTNGLLWHHSLVWNGLLGAFWKQYCWKETDCCSIDFWQSLKATLI